MPTTNARTSLQHRPFAALRQDLAPPPPADAVRAEIRALVTRGALNRRDGEDVLARLGLTSQPYRWAVGYRVPVTVTVHAPNDHYAQRVGAAQITAALGRLRTAYLASPQTVTAPTDHPAQHSLRQLRCRRTEPCPGYPAGGTYTVSADVLLAVTITADDAATACATARATLSAELDTDHEIDIRGWLIRRTGLHRLTDLEHCVDDNTPPGGQQRVTTGRGHTGAPTGHEQHRRPERKPSP